VSQSGCWCCRVVPSVSLSACASKTRAAAEGACPPLVEFCRILGCGEESTEAPQNFPPTGKYYLHGKLFLNGGASIEAPQHSLPEPRLCAENRLALFSGVGGGSDGGGDGSGGGWMEVCSGEGERAAAGGGGDGGGGAGRGAGGGRGGGDIRHAADLRGNSTRRLAPRGQIPLGGAALPEGAVWREVLVAVGKGGSACSTATYTWAFRDGNPLCKWCMGTLGSAFFHEGAKRAQEGRTLLVYQLFCSGTCLQEYYQRTAPGALRRAVRCQYKGVCAVCGVCVCVGGGGGEGCVCERCLCVCVCLCALYIHTFGSFLLEYDIIYCFAFLHFAKTTMICLRNRFRFLFMMCFTCLFFHCFNHVQRALLLTFLQCSFYYTFYIFDSYNVKFEILCFFY
jgi:hypothetical protein